MWKQNKLWVLLDGWVLQRANVDDGDGRARDESRCCRGSGTSLHGPRKDEQIKLWLLVSVVQYCTVS